MLRIRGQQWSDQRFPEIGRGAEAILYLVKPDTVAKVYLLPEDPTFRDSSLLQQAAAQRLEQIQTKLFDFPPGLPETVIVPTGVLEQSNGRIYGYVMPFIQGVPLADLTRTSAGLTAETLQKLLLGLYDTLSGIHSARAVVGDFNENNVLVVPGFTPNVVDADSMQFGPYKCQAFLPRFTPPELMEYQEPKPVEPQTVEVEVGGDPCPDCRRYHGSYVERKVIQKIVPAAESPAQLQLVAEHTVDSDWYAFLVMAMRLLTHTDPYGGVVSGMELPERIQNRLTVFSPEVVYPQVAVPLKNMPRPLLELFFNTFVKGQRGKPDRTLFESGNIVPASSSGSWWTCECYLCHP